MLQQLGRRDPQIGQIVQRPAQNVNAIIAKSGHQTVQPGRLALREVVRNAGVSEFAVHLFAGHTDNVMDFVQLVQLVFAGKQWVEREYFVEDATDGPDVDFGIVVASGEQRFGSPIPTCRDVGGVWRGFGVASGRSEVGQLNNLGLAKRR